MDASEFLDSLEAAAVTFFAGVPDSYLNGFCKCLLERASRERNVIAANEGNAVAVAAGHYLATGETPLVYMQNSGLGNAVNPLASLACKPMLGIPMVLLIGWRGDPWHHDHVQHELQSRATPLILDALGIPYRVLTDGDLNAAVWAAEAARSMGGPVAILAPKGVLSRAKVPPRPGALPLRREDAIRLVVETVPRDAVFSATTGRAARELYWVREGRGESHECDYLNVGSMGHASSVALGIALAQPNRTVVCLDGDGAAIMHMGALAMQSRYATPNLLHVVLNNGEHESVGGQPSAGQTVDMTAVAEACGYSTVGSPVSSAEEVESAVRELCARPQAGFLDIRISSGIRSDLPPLEVEPAAMRDGLLGELAGI